MFRGLRRFGRDFKVASRRLHFFLKLFPGLMDDLKCRKFSDVNPDSQILREFAQACREKDLPDRYEALVKGLDPKSISEVNLILAVCQQVGQGRHPHLMLPDDEMAAAVEFRDTIQRRVVRLADNLYAWGPYRLTENKFYIESFFYKSGFDFLDRPDRISDTVFIDAGGFIGDSALVLGPHTSREIIVFEPFSQNVAKILANADLNNLAKLIVEQLALGDRSGQVTISGTYQQSSASTIINPQAVTEDQIRSGRAFRETVPMVTIDDYVRERNIDRIGLIKSDVEGAEMMLLQGARRTIEEHRPALLISMYHSARDFFEIKPLIESWGLGYRFKIRRCPGMLVVETMLIAEAE